MREKLTHIVVENPVVSPVGSPENQHAAEDGGYYNRGCPAPVITGIFWALSMVLVAVTMTSSVQVREAAFCAPAAHLAGILSGAPCVRDGDNYRLIGSGLDLSVVPSCSAADYFCLMAGFLSLLVTWRGFHIRVQFLIFPAAWTLTILINAIRLTACWQTDRLAQTLLPASVWPATHMAVGIVTFLIGLTLIFWVMTRRGRNSWSTL
jgi:exosortase/archaeosortase family protein